MGYKLTPEEQHQVCQWFAQFYKTNDIVRFCQEQFGKTIARNNIWDYAQSARWKPLIERLRQQWALSIMDVPMAHKRTRLGELVKLLERAEKNGQVSEYARIKQCMDLLTQMREEMEAGKTQFTNVYMTTIHNYSDEEIVRRRDEVLEKLGKLKGLGHGTRHVREAEVTSTGQQEEVSQAALPAPGSVDQGREGAGGGSEHRGHRGRPAVDQDTQEEVDARQV